MLAAAPPASYRKALVLRTGRLALFFCLLVALYAGSYRHGIPLFLSRIITTSTAATYLLIKAKVWIVCDDFTRVEGARVSAITRTWAGTLFSHISPEHIALVHWGELVQPEHYVWSAKDGTLTLSNETTRELYEFRRHYAAVNYTETCQVSGPWDDAEDPPPHPWSLGDTAKFAAAFLFACFIFTAFFILSLAVTITCCMCCCVKYE